MDVTGLEDLIEHINAKISAVKTIFQLKSLTSDNEKRQVLKKLNQDILVINEFLNKLEAQIFHQIETLKSLKDLEEIYGEDMKELVYLSEHIPAHMPKKCSRQSMEVIVQAEPKETKPEKKISKPWSNIKEMEFITMAEFEEIPGYMKGRLTYPQVNSVIQDFNKAVVGKYKIMQLPVKSLNNASRKLLQRFKDEELKTTKGLYFIVDADIKEFTQMKVDKKFHGMLNILRHCRRMREVRDGGLVRYIVL
ncbi:spindle and kinetochore-associated protein 1 [Erpetoichthys calabaricus]|uniref:SKA complex subunit 1 n=1 Tax=Erpetoichthys calabaricus TaxID=27687 RepID=A0A8C4RR42_ERPCA|nr:spindle and kinetochore-associated protein 1 [Erpetoichthys calabaricus]